MQSHKTHLMSMFHRKGQGTHQAQVRESLTSLGSLVVANYLQPKPLGQIAWEAKPQFLQ